MKELNEEVKSIFMYIINNLKTPEVPGGILVILLIYKYFCNANFNNILNKLMYEYSIIPEIIQVILDLLIILCIIAFFILIFAVFVTIGSVVIRTTYESKGKKIPKIIDKFIESSIQKSKGYVNGSTMFILHKITWMLILGGYLYILDESMIKRYLNIILDVKGTSHEPILAFFLIIGMVASLNLGVLIVRKYYYKKY